MAGKRNYTQNVGANVPLVQAGVIFLNQQSCQAPKLTK